MMRLQILGDPALMQELRQVRVAPRRRCPLQQLTVQHPVLETT